MTALPGAEPAQAADADETAHAAAPARPAGVAVPAQGARRPRAAEERACEQGEIVTGRRFKTLLCDPPWTFKVWGGTMGSRTAESHYAVQSADFIRELPVSEVAEKESTLLLWATIPHLPEALELITAWGFEYRSGIVWAKMSRAGAPRIGLGYHARNCAELLLIAQRGSPGAPLPSDRPHGMMFSPPGEHSRKPDWQYDLAENYEGPYLELFCRPRFDNLFGPRANWTHLGNEVDGLDIRDALAQLIEATP